MNLKNKCYDLIKKDNDGNKIVKIKDGYLCFISKDSDKLITFGFTNPYWKENVELFTSNMKGNSKILSIKKITKNKKNRILVEAICDCGEKFNWIFQSNLKKTDKFMCAKCKKKITASKRRLKFHEVQKICSDNGFKILSTETSFNQTTDKILLEDENGYRGYMTLNHIKRHQHFSVFSSKYNDEFILYNARKCVENNGYNIVINSVDNSKYYKGGFNCTCKCGKKFTSPIFSMVSGSKIMCEECAMSISKYERMVRDFLEKNNIQFIAEYCYNDCRDILPLPFDFYINGKLIEIDGEGHFYPCHFNQISYENATKSFEITRKHDIIKNNYCQNKNIPLLRIDYNSMNDGSYKEKILSFIRE